MSDVKTALEQLYAVDPNEIKLMKVADLKSLGKGIVANISKMRKAEIVDALLDLQASGISYKKALDAPTPDIKPVDDEERLIVDVDGSSIVDDSVINRICDELIVTLGSDEKHMIKQSKALDLSLDLASRLKMLNLHVVTKQKGWRLLDNKLQSQLDEYLSGQSKLSAKQVYREYFVKPIHRIVGDLRREENTQREEKLKQAATQMTKVDVAGVYNWMTDVFNRLETANWREISFALALATGRRQSEIHASARFIATGENHVTFMGQSKGITLTKYTDEYEIPTLVKADLVVKALERLNTLGKRIKDVDLTDAEGTKIKVKKAHDIYSKELALKTPEYLHRYLGKELGNGFSVSYKTARDLYAMTTYKLFCNDEMTVTGWVMSVLGHGDLKTALMYEKVLVTGYEVLGTQ